MFILGRYFFRKVYHLHAKQKTIEMYLNVRVGSWPYSNESVSPVKLGRDEHSSLFCSGSIYEEKSFKTLTSDINVLNFFFVVTISRIS